MADLDLTAPFDKERQICSLHLNPAGDKACLNNRRCLEPPAPVFM